MLRAVSWFGLPPWRPPRPEDTWFANRCHTENCNTLQSNTDIANVEVAIAGISNAGIANAGTSNAGIAMKEDSSRNTHSFTSSGVRLNRSKRRCTILHRFHRSTYSVPTFAPLQLV